MLHVGYYDWSDRKSDYFQIIIFLQAAKEIFFHLQYPGGVFILGICKRIQSPFTVIHIQPGTKELSNRCSTA